MRFMRSVCSSIPSQDCPLMADTCQNIFWVLIYPRSANATPLSHITIPLSIWMANAKSRPAVLAPSRAPADLPTKNGCTRLPIAVAITSRNYGQLSPTKRFSPRMGSTLYPTQPRYLFGCRIPIFRKNIAEFLASFRFLPACPCPESTNNIPEWPLAMSCQAAGGDAISRM